MYKNILIMREENYRAIYYNKISSLFLIRYLFFLLSKVVSLNVFFIYLFAISFIFLYY